MINLILTFNIFAYQFAFISDLLVSTIILIDAS